MPGLRSTRPNREFAIPMARWCSAQSSTFRQAGARSRRMCLRRKYFRKAGVPKILKRVEENDVPSFLWRSVPDEAALADLPEGERYRLGDDRPSRCSTALPAAGPIGAGRAAISTRRRMRRPSTTNCASCWRRRCVAPNSPQWFNTGLALGLWHRWSGQGHFYVDYKTGKLTQVEILLRAPPAACLLHPGRRR